jgi:hypothetical protein
MNSRTSVVWYCVLGIADFRLVYLGDDKKQAAADGIPGTHTATGATRGAAHRNAAIGVGFLKRNQPVPDLSSHDEAAE